MAQLREWDEGANRFLDFPKDTAAALGLSVAMYSQISVRSVRASGWRTNPLMNGGGLGSLGAVGQMPFRRRWAELIRS